MPKLISDLPVMLLTAGVVAVVFKRLKLPPVPGYIPPAICRRGPNRKTLSRLPRGSVCFFVCQCTTPLIKGAFFTGSSESV